MREEDPVIEIEDEEEKNQSDDSNSNSIDIELFDYEDFYRFESNLEKSKAEGNEEIIENGESVLV